MPSKYPYGLSGIHIAKPRRTLSEDLLRALPLVAVPALLVFVGWMFYGWVR